MRIDSLKTAEISTNCVKVHRGNVDKTVEEALRAILPSLLESVDALKVGKYSKGAKIVIGYGVQYPEK